MAKEDNLKPFKPGQSGNPKGRPKKLPSLDKLLPEVLGDEADNDSEISQILRKLVERAKTKYGDRAAEILLERAYGKAKQTNEVRGDVTVVIRHE